MNRLTELIGTEMIVLPRKKISAKTQHLKDINRKSKGTKKSSQGPK